MSRAPNAAPDTIIVRPSNDVYTALAGVALVAVVLGILAVWMKAGEIFGGLLSTQ